MVKLSKVFVVAMPIVILLYLFVVFNHTSRAYLPFTGENPNPLEQCISYFYGDMLEYAIESISSIFIDAMLSRDTTELEAVISSSSGIRRDGDILRTLHLLRLIRLNEIYGEISSDMLDIDLIMRNCHNTTTYFFTLDRFTGNIEAAWLFRQNTVHISMYYYGWDLHKDGAAMFFAANIHDLESEDGLGGSIVYTLFLRLENLSWKIYRIEVQ